MNNYILESMDITDVSIDDIEYEKQLAEINVIEAMVECYEKQLVLLEYNEESAEEIMMEYGIIMEASDDKRPLSVKAKAVFNKMISALKTLVLSIIDQIRAANFKKLAKMINNMEGAGIKVKKFKVHSSKFKNRDSVFIIVNGRSINDKLSKIGDDLNFLGDDRLLAEIDERDESAKKEYIDKCDDIIEVSNDLFDDIIVGDDWRMFGKDQLIDICLFCDGQLLRSLRSYAHKLEKWNVEYSKDEYLNDCTIISKLREVIKALIKALTRYSKALIPIVKVIRNILKEYYQKERSNESKNVKFSEKDKDFMELIHELAKIYDNVDKYLQ